MNRPVNHMPCSPDEATVAVLGEGEFEKYKDRWRCPELEHIKGTTKTLIRCGASFFKPVPNPPENTRELAEEEMAAIGEVFGWSLSDNGKWVEYKLWDIGVMSVGGTEPWRCRVPIEPKVVAWVSKPPSICREMYYGYFANEEDREHAVALAKAEERCRELVSFVAAVDDAFHMYDRDMTSLSGAMELIVDARAALEGK